MNVFDFLTRAQVADIRARARAFDITSGIQRAINSLPGTLHFPSGDYVVTPGKAGFALLVQSQSIVMTGDDATIVMPSTGNHQALRMERCVNSSISGLRFRGSGTNGSNGGQGLVQVFLGTNFTAENCAFDDANCDGLAVAGVSGVTISHCTSTNASKAALYVNKSSSVRITGNSVSEFGGHNSGGKIVGAGLQLSGNSGLIANENRIHGGIGAGILCDNSHSDIPRKNVIVHNTVENVTNPTNPELSSGIRLTNTAAVRGCRTEVSGNTVLGCSPYNYFIENHDGAIIKDNVGIGSAESNFVFSSLRGASITGNTAVNSDMSRRPGQAAFYILNGSHSVAGAGNRAVTDGNSTTIPGVNRVIDATGNTNPLLLRDS